MASGSDPGRLGTSSPFNIKVSSPRLPDFSEPEVRALYAQHTAETGQRFAPEAVDLAWQLTRGQPWLVNALAAEAVDRLVRDRAVPIDTPAIEQASEFLQNTDDFKGPGANHYFITEG